MPASLPMDLIRIGSLYFDHNIGFKEQIKSEDSRDIYLASFTANETPKNNHDLNNNFITSL